MACLVVILAHSYEICLSGGAAPTKWYDVVNVHAWSAANTPADMYLTLLLVTQEHFLSDCTPGYLVVGV